MHSTISGKFRTTVPLRVRGALKLKPRQRISYELRPDGSTVIRPVPHLDELFGSIKIGRTVASTHEEKQSARNAIAREEV